MRNPVNFVLADPDYYAPLHIAGRRLRELAPSAVPADWTSTTRDVWTTWTRPDLQLPAAGWKVHVSACPERLDAVLDTVAEVCFEQHVAFKHLSCLLFYNAMHAKHANRAQAGKFIAAYPSTADASRKLMNRLAKALDGEEGPYILTDRRYRDSKNVFYRYGAYHRIERALPDGTMQSLVPDAAGRLVEDVRGVSFHLPAGIVDPFVEPAEKPTPLNGGKSSIEGFTFETALQHSSSGGAYRAVEDATGRTVFIKEARAHTGFGHSHTSSMDRLRREWQTLQALNTLVPGLAPEAIAYFPAWEHEFMVTEFVEGTQLGSWTVANNPWIRTASVAEDFLDYGRRQEEILSQVEQAFELLHAAGYAFVDVSPSNVLVDAEDRVRLIDFEAACRLGGEFEPIGTPGYTPPADRAGVDPLVHDSYGRSGLALLTLTPFHHVAERHPAALDLLRRDLEARGHLSETVWEQVLAEFRPEPAAKAEGRAGTASGSDTVSQLDRLRSLRDGVASALTAMADVERPGWVYPTIAEGFLSNTLCVSYGTTGVVHALRKSGLEVPETVVSRLCRDAMDQADRLAPGLFVGLAGIAWVLADSGRLEEAGHLLDLAVKHPVLAESATFATGCAGVALASAALYGHTGDQRHLERAGSLVDGLPADDALTPFLGADDAVGLFHGRAGIALTLRQLAVVTGDDALTRRGLRLLHAELDRASESEPTLLAFPVSRTDRRRMPYIFAGTAGILHVATRYIDAVEDERLAEATPRMLNQLDARFTVFSGLCQGMSGLAFVLAEHARLTGDDASRARAIDVADGLVKYSIPHETGIRFLGDQNQRFSAELWGGSAGILLSLSQILEPRPDPFFTLDALARPAMA